MFLLSLLQSIRGTGNISVIVLSGILQSLCGILIGICRAFLRGGGCLIFLMGLCVSRLGI